MPDFKREPRYIVFKLKDIEAHLSPVEKQNLMDMGNAISCGRKREGKSPFNAVVVEQDWPEFEPTWEAIEARMEREDLIATIAAMNEENAQLAHRLWCLENPRLNLLSSSGWRKEPRCQS